MQLIAKGHIAAAKHTAFKLSLSPHGGLLRPKQSRISTKQSEVATREPSNVGLPLPSKFVLVKGVEVEPGSKAEAAAAEASGAALQNQVKATHAAMAAAVLKQDAAKAESFLQYLQKDGYNPLPFDIRNRIGKRGGRHPPR